MKNLGRGSHLSRSWWRGRTVRFRRGHKTLFDFGVPQTRKITYDCYATSSRMRFHLWILRKWSNRKMNADTRSRSGDSKTALNSIIIIITVPLLHAHDEYLHRRHHFWRRPKLAFYLLSWFWREWSDGEKKTPDTYMALFVISRIRSWDFCLRFTYMRCAPHSNVNQRTYAEPKTEQ